MCPTEDGEDAIGDCVSGFLVSTEEVGDPLTVVGGDLSEADNAWIERVGFASGAVA
jgi:hypothetical protein